MDKPTCTQFSCVDNLKFLAQCRGGSGACPDTVDTTTGSTCTNDVTDVSGFVQEGQQCISFTRPFNPSESDDVINVTLQIIIILLNYYCIPA